MSTATLELYNALLEVGVSKDKAELAAKAVINRQEAEKFLASKEDLLNLKNDMSRTMQIHSGFIVTATGVLIALFSLLS